MRTKSLLYTLSIAFLITANAAASNWVSIAPIYAGLIANDGAVSFSIGNKGYVASGSTVNDLYVYDTLANSWSIFGPVPATMGHAFAMSFVLNDKAYIIGGDTGGIPLKTVWEFDPASANPWTQKNDFVNGVRDAGFAFTINNVGYVGGGFDGTNLYNDIWKYDQPNDSWTLVGNLPLSGLLFPTSFVIGNKGYILTGGTPPNGVNETNKMWSFDGTNDSIEACADFLGVPRQAAFAFSNSSNGFVGGGQAGFTTNYYDMFMYDPGNNQWSVQPDAPLLGAAWSSTFVIGNVAYLGLGAKFVATGLTGTDAFFKFSMEISTGIQSFVRENISISPNPATSFIKLPYKQGSESTISIYNSTGQIIRQEKNKEEISIEDLDAGIYIIQIQSNTSTLTGRFAKE